MQKFSKCLNFKHDRGLVLNPKKSLETFFSKKTSLYAICLQDTFLKEVYVEKGKGTVLCCSEVTDQNKILRHICCKFMKIFVRYKISPTI